jgi:hypothetical protein
VVKRARLDALSRIEDVIAREALIGVFGRIESASEICLEALVSGATANHSVTGQTRCNMSPRTWRCRATQRLDEAPHTGIARREPVVVDEVRPPGARQRPAQRANLLLRFVVQDVAHAATDRAFRPRVNVTVVVG